MSQDKQANQVDPLITQALAQAAPSAPVDQTQYSTLQAAETPQQAQPTPDQQPALPANEASISTQAQQQQLPPQPQSSQSTPAAPHKNPNSTQNTLMFQELRDNMIIMGDGTYRAIIATQSVNFDLMSGRERDGAEYSFQNFLNSLTFPIQIYIRSQDVDIGPYLEKLEKIRKNQDNMLLGVLMEDYMYFIEALSQHANIMDKSFFVIVPYALGDENAELGKDSDTTKGLLTNLFMPAKRHQNIKVPADLYEHAKEEIAKRVSSVSEGLSQIGINSIRLKTRELGELLYNVYNPDTATRQPIGDFRNYSADIVRRGDGPSPHQNGGFNA